MDLQCRPGVAAASARIHGLKADSRLVAALLAPLYLLFTLMGWPDCLCSSPLLFTLVYGYSRLASKTGSSNESSCRCWIFLQSIPVLGVSQPSPHLLLFVGLFPATWQHQRLEIAAIIAIFTGQAWKHDLQFLPGSVRCGKIAGAQTCRRRPRCYRFSWWQRFPVGSNCAVFNDRPHLEQHE